MVNNDLIAVCQSRFYFSVCGGQGIIMGRKVFKRSTAEGIKLLQAVQDVYLMREVAVC